MSKTKGTLGKVWLFRQAEAKWEERCFTFLSAQGFRRASLFRERNGKPALAEAGPWHCNASTTRDESLLALAPFPVGVDWEHLERKVSARRIAQRYFSREETAWMMENPGGTSVRFFQLWTAKEAAVKLDGCGLYGGGLCACRIQFEEQRPSRAKLNGRAIYLHSRRTEDGFLLTVAAYHDFQLANGW